jgi:hypothetical protein
LQFVLKKKEIIMPTTQIQVTAADNEVILIASTPAGSSELFHYKSGYNKPVNATIYPGAILATGAYTLTIIGINWGGPANFTVVVTTDGHAQTFHGGAGNSPAGQVWHQTVAMNIVSGQ